MNYSWFYVVDMALHWEGYVVYLLYAQSSPTHYRATDQQKFTYIMLDQVALPDLFFI